MKLAYGLLLFVHHKKNNTPGGDKECEANVCCNVLQHTFSKVFFEKLFRIEMARDLGVI